MVDQSDPKLASWSTDGTSFVIFDVDEFSKQVLPQYFKHSKFASFVRQLNFYSFRKLRSMTHMHNATHAATAKSKSVRFGHEYFRRGHPELLHKIQRITKGGGGGGGTQSHGDGSSIGLLEAKSLKEQICTVQHNLDAISINLDQRIRTITEEIESDYQHRMSKMTSTYQAFRNLNLLPTLSPPNKTCVVSVQGDEASSSSTRRTCTSSPIPCTPAPHLLKHLPPSSTLMTSAPPPAPPPPPTATTTTTTTTTKMVDTIPISPRSTISSLMSPLDTLSGIASAMLSHNSMDEM